MARFLNTHDSYGLVAQCLHWLVAALVFVQIGLGLYAAALPLSLARLQWLSRHKSLGLTILVLVLLRFAWRSIDRTPAPPESMRPWQRALAALTHRALYLLLVLAPLSGWMRASAAGLSVNWFGLFQVPDLLPKQARLADLLLLAHRGCVALLAFLILCHVLGALIHALVLRDGVVRRMLPQRRRTGRC